MAQPPRKPDSQDEKPEQGGQGGRQGGRAPGHGQFQEGHEGEESEGGKYPPDEFDKAVPNDREDEREREG
jgi:hypothetical protein